MASKDVRIVKRFVDPFIGRDLVAIFADKTQMDALTAALEPMLDPDYEFIAATGGMAAIDVNYRGRREALEGFFNGWGDWLSAWDTYVLELEEIRELRDGRILVLTRSHARSKSAGLELDAEHGLIYRVGNGKILRYEQYFDRNEAFKAAGLGASEN